MKNTQATRPNERTDYSEGSLSLTSCDAV